jgi:hypothetical protein
LLSRTYALSGPDHEKVFDLVEEKSDENVADVVAPREEQAVKVFLGENLLNDGCPLVNREVVQCLEEQVQGPRG